MSIRLKLFLSFAGIMTFSMYLYAYYAVKNVRPRYLAISEDILADTSVIFASFLSNKIKDEQIEIDAFSKMIEDAQKRRFKAKIYDQIKTRLELGVYISNKQGKIIYDSWNGKLLGKNYSQWNDVYLTLKGEYGARSTKYNANLDISDMFVSAPIQKNQKIYGVVSVGYRTFQIAQFVSEAKKRIIWGAFACLFISLLAAYLLGWWLTNPIMKLTQYARNIRDGKKSKALD